MVRRVLSVTLLTVLLAGLTTSAVAAGKAIKGSGIYVVGIILPFAQDPAVTGNCLITFYWSADPSIPVASYQVVVAEQQPKIGKKFTGYTTTTDGQLTVSRPSGTPSGFEVRIVQPDGTVRPWSVWFQNQPDPTC